MRIVFAGTPEPAVPSLRRLVDSDHDVIAVVSRPDAAKGRGRKVDASPVAQLARELQIPLLAPLSAKDDEFREQLVDLNPDVCAIVAYGAILPSSVLQVPRHGWVNLHFSILPHWRGAAPVQQAIWHGDDVTGATTFLLDEGMDTGPVFGTVTTSISRTDTAGTLLSTLADSGADLLAATLDGIAVGRLVPVPQPADGVSLAPKISVEDARVDWNLPAHVVERRIRACTPAPGSWTTFEDLRVRINPVTLADGVEVSIEPGELLVTKKDVFVGTSTNALRLNTVVPAGKREMSAADWARGMRLTNNESARPRLR